MTFNFKTNSKSIADVNQTGVFFTGSNHKFAAVTW